MTDDVVSLLGILKVMVFFLCGDELTTEVDFGLEVTADERDLELDISIVAFFLQDLSYSL